MTNTRLIGDVEGISPSSDNRPYVGYKVLGIRNPTATGEVSLFGPHYIKKLYGISSNHSCPKHRWRKSFESCQCGFYSYINVESAVKHWNKECLGSSNLAIVEVVLSGDIVLCKNGYRSTRQRVTKILFPNCWNCSEPGKSLVPHKLGSLVAACEDCVIKYSLAESSVSFDAFSQQASLPKFKRLSVSSATDINNEAFDFFRLKEEKNTPDEHLAQLLKSKDVFMLSEISKKLNAGIESIISEKFEDI